MYKFISIVEANDGKHKYKMVFLNTNTNKYKTVKFGAYGYNDYLITNDDKKKDAYIARHSVNENWNDPISKGTLSKFILWNKKDIMDSLFNYLEYFRNKNLLL